ncbi:MAG: hypothetical protein AB1452_13820 [Pseudomonadota bacterium]
MSPVPISILALAVLGAIALPASAAGAKGSGESSAIHQRFLEERAGCESLSGDDRTTCRREAGAAQIEARRGTLSDEGGDFERNRLARCEFHQRADEREYCLRRMRGEGTVTGSVEGGGLLRELTVTVPAE